MESALRLRLGQVLEVVGRGKHFELGFSSVAAYVLERCERSVRWVEAARCLARRVEALPELRRAMALGGACGRVSWSMGELLARVAQSDDEAGWIELAKSRTVRQVRVLVFGAMANERAAGRVVLKEPAAAVAVASAAALAPSASEVTEDEASEEMCTLTCTVDREEGWLFEATRALLGQLGEHSVDSQIESLLAEGQGTLLAALPRGALDIDRLGSVDTGQQHWLQELGRWRAEAEARCEEHFLGSVLSGREGSGSAEPAQVAQGAPVAQGARDAVAVAAALGCASLEGAGCRELDAIVRGLSHALVTVRRLELVGACAIRRARSAIA